MEKETGEKILRVAGATASAMFPAFGLQIYWYEQLKNQL